VILAIIVAASAMTQMAPQALALTKASASAEELFKTIDRKSEIDPLSNEGKIPTSCHGVIEIQDIVFTYPARSDITVLKGLTLSVPANKTTALVGASMYRPRKNLIMLSCVLLEYFTELSTSSLSLHKALWVF
jgi:ATP-binding cassette subfamily B (MDR/TAP) protein 1